MLHTGITVQILLWAVSGVLSTSVPETNRSVFGLSVAAREQECPPRLARGGISLEAPLEDFWYVRLL